MPDATDNTCQGCGCGLAHDHTGAHWCSPCARSRRDYNPRHDPGFVDQLAAFFTEHPGQLVFPMDALCVHPLYRYAVKDGVRALRKQRGMCIVGRERRGGYTYHPEGCPST